MSHLSQKSLFPVAGRRGQWDFLASSLALWHFSSAWSFSEPVYHLCTKEGVELGKAGQHSSPHPLADCRCFHSLYHPNFHLSLSDFFWLVPGPRMVPV